MDYLNSFDSPALTAAVILCFYIIAAKAADIITNRVLRRLARVTESHIDDRIIDLLHRPVFFTVIIFGVIHSIEIVKAPERVVYYSNGMLYTVLALLWTICVIKISNLLIESSIHRVRNLTGLSKELTPLIENMWTVLLIVGSTMLVLSIWEVNITPLLASAGIVGVAVALAAKDTLANFFGGISIFIDKPYKIGDYIVLDSGERGEVVNIGVRSTRIKTRDDILVTIPNSIIANTKIINESAPVPKFRIRIPVTVSYGTDVGSVEKILLDISRDNANVQDEPEARVRFRTFGESSLNFELLCWAKEPALRGMTIHEINTEIYSKFNETGIKFPFPHRTVYLREEKDWKKD
jgi:small-conductance mechanosensitive channel